MDPALAQAISAITGAVVMLIIAATSYYFPRGVSRFDREEREREKRESDHDDEKRHHHSVEDDTRE